MYIAREVSTAGKRNNGFCREMAVLLLSGMEKALTERLGGTGGSVNITGIEPGETGNGGYPQPYLSKLGKIKSALASSSAWEDLVEDLHRFFSFCRKRNLWTFLGF